MRKTCVLLLAMMCAGVVWGQKSRVAVYLTAENVESDVTRLVNNQVINALTKTGKYTMIERNEAFAKKVEEERLKQLSGSVSDKQIAALAEAYGAEAICIAEVGTFKEELSLDMRIVSVEKETIIHSGSKDGRYNGISDIRKIVDRAVADMLDSSSENRQTAGQQSQTGNTSSNGLPCPEEFDTANYFTGFGYSYGARHKENTLKNAALNNAKEDARQKMQHTYSGTVTTSFSYSDSGMDDDIQGNIGGGGKQKITDRNIDDAIVTCRQCSSPDAKGNITCYASIRINK